jgi:16S rRNA (guanine527-N7)-methyltransferase
MRALVALPALSREQLALRLARVLPGFALDDALAARLLGHYEALRRWAPRVDLIGPGAVGELVERHYGEALAALDWIPAAARRLVDLGSGAGFPGFVLAAARPELEVWLIEPRARRAAFLAAAARRAQLSLRVVNARVAAASLPELPSGIDILTVRALRLEPPAYGALLPRLVAGARLLSWSGETAPELPPGFVAGRSRRLAGSERRFLREYLVRQGRA